MAYALTDRRGRSLPARREGDRLGAYNPPPAPPAAPPPSDEGFDAAQLWAILRANRRLIVMVAVGVFVATMTLTMVSRMQFRSSGRLYLGELEGKNLPQRAANEIDLSGGEPTDLGSEIQILQSESLVTRAILDSGANVQLVPAGYRSPRFYKWLLSGRDQRLLEAATKELKITDSALVDNSVGVTDYRVKFISNDTYQVYGKESSFGGDDVDRLLGQGKIGQTTKLPSLRVRLDKGTRGGPKTGAEYDLRVWPLDDIVRDVGKIFVVNVPKPLSQTEMARVVQLEFESKSPHLAASFLRELMHGYLAARQSWKTEDATAAELFVSNQLQTMRASLDKTEQKVADYRSNTNGMVLDEEARGMVEQIGKYEEQRVAARLQIAAFTDMKRALKMPNPQLEAFMFGEASDSVLTEQASSLAKAQRELTDLESRYSSSAPDVKEKKAQVDAQLITVRNYVVNRLSRAQESLNALNQVIRQYENKLKSVPGAELGLNQLSRESEVYSRLYSYLLERQQQAAIVKASKVSKNRILDFPQVPYKESSPVLAMRFASAPIGLLLGAIFVILRALFATTLQSERDVRRVIGNIPIFASIPRLASGPDKRHDPSVKLDILGQDPASGVTEAFRTLRTHLYRAAANDTGQVVLITSPCPGDGKTTCLLSLATMLSADRKRVLVIDADMRSPTHHLMFNTPQEPGLSTVLTGRFEWDDVLHPITFASGRFESVNTGALYSAELLSSEHLVAFLAYAKLRYDFILLDSPSFPMVSDALVLAGVSDCVLSVMRLHETTRRLAIEHMRRLDPESRAFGVVVNGVSPAEGYQGSLAAAYRGRTAAEPSDDQGSILDLLPKPLRKRATTRRLRVRLSLAGSVVLALLLAVVVSVSRRERAPLPVVPSDDSSHNAGPEPTPLPTPAELRTSGSGEPAQPAAQPQGASGAPLLGPGAALPEATPAAESSGAGKVVRVSAGQVSPAPPPERPAAPAAVAPARPAPAAPASKPGPTSQAAPSKRALGRASEDRRVPAARAPARANPYLPVNPY
jgi:tyrosine-protein kinase Etk/Wzc